MKLLNCFNRRMMDGWWSYGLEWAQWPTFLLHKFGTQSSPFELEKWIKKSSEGKKDVAKSVHEACCSRIQIRTLTETTWWTFWNCMIFPQIICNIVPYARDLLPIKFFFSSFKLNVP